MLGQGVAVIPSEGKICAPADGEIAMVFDTLHAVSLNASNGAEILVHVGPVSYTHLIPCSTDRTYQLCTV